MVLIQGQIGHLTSNIISSEKNLPFSKKKLGPKSSAYNKVAGAGANCDHQNSKLCAVAGAEVFWVAELRVRQLKIGRKSCLIETLE